MYLSVRPLQLGGCTESVPPTGLPWVTQPTGESLEARLAEDSVSHRPYCSARPDCVTRILIRMLSAHRLVYLVCRGRTLPHLVCVLARGFC